MNRRHFLRGSAAAAAASPLFAARPARAASAQDPDALRIGLVGCGGRGTGAAYQALLAEEGTVVLTAMADLFEDRLAGSLATLRESLGEEMADRIQVPEHQRFLGFDAFERLLESDVDVVLLATPPHFRPAHLEKAVEAGKHIFCEKPFAVDAPGVRRAMAAAEAAAARNLALVSGFCWRYNVRHRELFERVHAGALGKIHTVYTTYNAAPNAVVPREDGWSDMEWQVRNWFHVLWLGGDHIVEQACHSLDKMAWAMGDVEPLSVTAVGGRQVREVGNIYDHFSATFEYPGGARGFHMSRQMVGCAFDNSDHMHGEKGSATIDGWVPHHEITGQEPWIYEGEGNDMYQQEHDELFASIRAGKPINDGAWASKSSLLPIMARMAAYTGQTVTWEQALASNDRLGPETYRLGWVGMRPVARPGQTKLF